MPKQTYRVIKYILPIYLAILMVVSIYAEENVSSSSKEPSTNNSGQNLNEDNSSEKLVNRKVLILDFVNLKNSPDYEYLESSIPETISSSLDKTKKFEILDRNIWTDALKSGKYEKKDAFDQKKASELAKSAEADVVLIGAFVAEEGKMQIFAKVVELESGRVMINRREKSALDTTMFDSIDNLSNELSGEMTKKPPPVEQKVVVVQKEVEINWDDKNFSVSLLPGFLLKDQIACGACELPLVLDARFWPFASANSGLRNLYAGVQFDYTHLWNGAAINADNSTGLVDGIIFAGYGFALGRFYIHGDVGAGYFITLNNEMIRNPVFEARLGAEILISPVLSLGIGIYGRMYYDTPAPLFFWGIGPSVNFVFGKK